MRNSMRIRRALWLLAFNAVSVPAHAEELLTYSTGTGFFINRDGYLLTNHHVVAPCKNISLSGAGNAKTARLIASDAAHDLALLKADSISPEASLSSVKQPLRQGDPVVVVGYPGQSWETGKTQTREAHIIDTKGPRGEEKWLQFSDSLVRGNSGGPLLDGAGNVVGVVVAKAKLISYNETSAREEVVQRFDLAISLPVIRQFLESHNIRYSQADSGIYLSPDRVTDIARRFVVNVRCRIDS